MKTANYPALTINLDAVAANAKVFCDICSKYSISVAGVIKFSDGDVEVAKAYAQGGCAQIGVSRAKHLQAIKEALPDKETLLTRAPARCDVEAAARFADLSLHSDAELLTAMNAAAEKWGTRSITNTIGREIGKTLIRGVLGSLFGGRR